MGVKVIFIGHSSVLLSFEHKNYLLDPIYNEKVVFYHRKKPPGIPFEELPPIHGILISHGHYDHFDRLTIEKFPKTTPLFVAKGLRHPVELLGFERIYEFSAWETVSIEGVTITATPAQHSGKQPFFHDPSEFIGFVIQHREKTVYFAGDTGYFPGFREIGKRFQIDVALLPIGAYRPRKNFKKHMNPPDALRAFEDLGAKWMIPIHWGTFRLGLEPVDEPAIWLKKLLEGKNSRVRILQPGESAEF